MMDELKEITERYATGYTMARYGTRDAIHQQMSEDIHTLIHLVKKCNKHFVSNNERSEESVCDCGSPVYGDSDQCAMCIGRGYSDRP